MYVLVATFLIAGIFVVEILVMRVFRLRWAMFMPCVRILCCAQHPIAAEGDGQQQQQWNEPRHGGCSLRGNKLPAC
jgi:hypothetical protein